MACGDLVLAIVSVLAAPSSGDESGCVVCHGEQARELLGSVHARSEMGCVDCHGGDPLAMEKDAAHGDDLRALGAGLAAVGSCGECHSDLTRMRHSGLRTDQLALYWTSAHGARLREEPDADVATCVSCHGAHEVRGAEDPRSPTHPFRAAETCASCHGDAERMEPYGLDAGVPERYRSSVHARGLLEQGHLSSPSCTDCHGAHGATPPRVEDVGRVCGHCHSTVQEHFEAGPHLAAALAGDMGECTSCHGAHGVERPSLDMLLGAEEGHCGACHERGSGAFATAERLHGELTAFAGRLTETRNELARAGEEGLFIDQEHDYLDEAESLRVRARGVVHAVSEERLEDLLVRGDGMVDDTRRSLELKYRAWRDRRILTAALLVVVALLVGVLLVYRSEIAGGPGVAGSRGDGDADRG